MYISTQCLSLSLAISESEVCIENQCLSVSLSILELFSLHYDTFLQKTKARTCAVFQRGKKEQRTRCSRTKQQIGKINIANITSSILI